MNCNKPAKKRGWCEMHYCRWRSTGDPLKTKRDGQIVDHLIVGTRYNRVRLSTSLAREIRAKHSLGVSRGALAAQYGVGADQNPASPHQLEGNRVMTHTLMDLEARYGLTHHDYLDRNAEVPTVSSLGFQGDVAIIRCDSLTARTPIPVAGYPVVRGEVGANTHLLVGDGFYDASTSASPQDLRLGVLTAPEGGTTLLSHPEHGGILIAPGSYEIRRQREMAEEMRMVAD
ncbi:hypothetical protein [Mycobacterium persicum]|nr:hypothetical protein [Mycobacterium persicum]